MRSCSLSPLALSIFSLLVACRASSDAESRPAEGPPVSDSAGTPYVANPAPAPDDPTLALSASPLATIGTAEGAPTDQLFRANQAVVLSDGTIVVANAGTQELRFYDGEGKYLRAAGRKGEGPGEFGANGFTLIGTYPGDSLVTADRSLKRISIFDGKGKYARSFPFPESVGLLPLAVGVLSDGRVVVLDDLVGPGHEQSPRLRIPAKVFTLSRDGTSTHTLGEFPGGEASTSPGAVAPVYFGRSLHVRARGDRIAIANDDAYSVRIYDGDGRLIRIVRQARPPVPVKEGDFESMIPEGLRPGGAQTNTPLGRQFLPLIEQMYRHTTLPAFGGEVASSTLGAMRFDAVGDLWVQEYRMRREDPEIWQVFDTAGAFLGRLDLPARTSLLEIGTDRVLLKVVDDLDVEHVALYGLERGGRPEAP